MNSEHPPVRVLGQRSLHSTFLFRSPKPNSSSDCKEDVDSKTPNKDSRVSLSDFLNRKLSRSSALPTSAEGKDRPFSSPVSKRDMCRYTGQNGIEKREEAEVEPVLDVVFELLKCPTKENGDYLGSRADGGSGSCSTDNVHESRKRKKSFAGEGMIQYAPKNLVVLGEDSLEHIHPIPKRKKDEQSSIATKKPGNYNHYANGRGWWDCNKEGVDNEEVGCNEVWEGIGSATIGGLEWH